MSSVPANVYQSTLDPSSTPPRLFGGVEGLREYRNMPHGQTALVGNDGDVPWYFVYLADDTTADDGEYVIRPTSVDTLEPGRWRRVGVYWDSIVDKPTEFPPEAHTHVLADITDYVGGGGGSPTWEFYALTWSTTPTFVATIAAGDVYSYTLNSTTRYRLVPNPYDATDDAFYSTFVNPTLSGLIVARG
jgi:hypothetical protein